jgi:hypothetical protein
LHFGKYYQFWFLHAIPQTNLQKSQSRGFSSGYKIPVNYSMSQFTHSRYLRRKLNLFCCLCTLDCVVCISGMSSHLCIHYVHLLVPLKVLLITLVIGSFTVFSLTSNHIKMPTFQQQGFGANSRKLGQQSEK